MMVILISKQETLIDDLDYDLIKDFKWWIVKGKQDTMYAQTKLNLKSIFMHQLLLSFTFIDHINHNGLDNRRINLRLVTNQQNSFNARKTNKPTSSNYKGVVFDKNRNKWIAQIKHNYKHIFLGRYDIEEQAAIAYDNAARQLFGEYAHLNFKD